MAFSPVESQKEYSFHRHLHKKYPIITGGKGNYIFTDDGNEVFDASSGAAVSCLGHGNERVTKAIIRQLETGTPYLASSFWANDIVERLCKFLIQGTGGKMSRVFLTGSGSEAIEAALKLSRQYFLEKEGDKAVSRVNFIAREGSYHGNTLGALSVSGHVARKKPYESILMENIHYVSSCYPYRQQKKDQSTAAFVETKAAELEAKILELGHNTVLAFIAEPIVGAALGCVPCVHGYLKAMHEVCRKYGILFILDEIMCGMGRTGSLHVWQAEDVVPDIQTNAKALGAGYQPIGAMMVSHEVVERMMKGSGEFVHGLTYQAMPIQAAAALKVQQIIQEDNLLENVSKQGALLGELLKVHLGNHPNVGDIRGRGLFWAIEFVKDKISKDPLESNVAYAIRDLILSPPFNMTVYPGTGTVDGVRGDHIILAPPYTVEKKDIEKIVITVLAAVHLFFSKLSD